MQGMHNKDLYFMEVNKLLIQWQVDFGKSMFIKFNENSTVSTK